MTSDAWEAMLVIINDPRRDSAALGYSLMTRQRYRLLEAMQSLGNDLEDSPEKNSANLSQDGEVEADFTKLSVS